MLHLKKLSDFFAQSLFQKNLSKYRIKRPKYYRRYQKRYI